MSGHGERAESAQVPTVFQGDQAERNDDEEDGFFVYVPAEKEGGIGAEGGCGDEMVPGRAQEELDESGLIPLAEGLQRIWMEVCLQSEQPKLR